MPHAHRLAYTIRTYDTDAELSEMMMCSLIVCHYNTSRVPIWHIIVVPSSRIIAY